MNKTPEKLLPDAAVIQEAIAGALRETGQIIKNKAVANVNRLLYRTGRLADSIYARVRKRKGGASLTVGTKLLYGRFWEYGFLRGAKSVSGLVRGKARKHRGRTAYQKDALISQGARLYRRPWLPRRHEAEALAARAIEQHLDEALKQYSGSHTIDIDIKLG